MVSHMKNKTTDRCAICLKRKGRRYCPDIHRNICPSCCAPKRAEKKCTSTFCRHGFEKVWIEDTATGPVERRVFWTPSKRDYLSEINAELVAWCHKPCPALDGKKPIDVSKTSDGKQKLIKIIDDLESRAKALKRPESLIVDYTPMRKELGLLKRT